MTDFHTIYYPCKLCIKCFDSETRQAWDPQGERGHFVFFKGVEVGFPHKWDGVDNVTKTWTLGKEEPGFQLLLMCDCGQVILLGSIGSDLQN